MSNSDEKDPKRDSWPLIGPARTLIGRILQIPLTILILLYFLFDDLVLSWLRPLFAWLGGLQLFVRMSTWMRSLGPYASLGLFLVPVVALEPFKIGGLVLIGVGRVKSGTIMLAAAHILSLLIVERIFHVTSPKLLTIPWFAWGYRLLMAMKDWAYARVRSSRVWQAMVALYGRLREIARPAVLAVERVVGSIAAAIRKWISSLPRRREK